MERLNALIDAYGVRYAAALGALVALVAFYRQLLEIRELRLKNAELEEAKNKRASSLHIPSNDEIEKYGRKYVPPRWGLGVAVYKVMPIGVAAPLMVAGLGLCVVAALAVGAPGRTPADDNAHVASGAGTAAQLVFESRRADSLERALRDALMANDTLEQRLDSLRTELTKGAARCSVATRRAEVQRLSTAARIQVLNTALAQGLRREPGKAASRTSERTAEDSLLHVLAERILFSSSLQQLEAVLATQLAQQECMAEALDQLRQRARANEVPR
jgi:hypothetical protein